MRVDRLGVGIEEVLHHVVGVDLAHSPCHAGIALPEGFRYRFRLVSGELELEDVVLDPPPPVVVEGRGAPRPGCIAAVELELLFPGEIEFADGELGGGPRPVLHAQQVAAEHVEREIEPAAAQGVVDPGPVEVEVGNVAGEEHAVTRVEDVDIAIEDAGAELVVERDLAIVIAAHELHDGPGRPGVRGGGPDRLRLRRACLPRAGGRAAEGGEKEGSRQHEPSRAPRHRASCEPGKITDFRREGAAKLRSTMPW